MCCTSAKWENNIKRLGHDAKLIDSHCTKGLLNVYNESACFIYCTEESIAI